MIELLLFENTGGIVLSNEMPKKIINSRAVLSKNLVINPS